MERNREDEIAAHPEIKDMVFDEEKPIVKEEGTREGELDFNAD